jgi:type II secretory pathway component GspD/PulD (secretin)
MTMVVAGLLALALSCGVSSFQRGRYLATRGQWDEAVENYEKAYKAYPKNIEYKYILLRAKTAASQMHFEEAKRAIAHEDMEAAVTELQKALEYDPSNPYVRDTFQKVVAAVEKREKDSRRHAVTLDEMKKAAQRDSGVKKIDPKSNIPIVLKFTGAPIKTVLDALSKASGVNFLYDEKVDSAKKVTVDFSNVTLESALDFIMMQSKHFYKVLDLHTLIVVPDNKQKREEYDEQVMRTFYLSNADAKDVFQLVRSIIQGKKMAMNQDLNSITIKDSPETVALAQKIIEANDKSKGEVIIDVELVEVNSDKTRTIGLDLTSKTFQLGPEINVARDDKGNATGWADSTPPRPLNSADVYNRGLWIGPIPNIVLKLILSDSESKVLARPQLRVLEGKKASVHIGDRVPIPTANLSYSTGGTTGSNYVPMTSYTYQDVGVKIELEPKVHHNKEVTMKLTAEVSSVTGTVKGSGFTPDQPIIGTRKLQSEIRLEDGETSLLAGLIREEDRTALSGMPFISEIPILKYLFSSTDHQTKRTDVIALLTPHIVRMPNITEEDLRPLWVGTEERPHLQGYRETSFEPGPFEGNPQDVAAPADSKAKDAEKAAEKAKETEKAQEADKSKEKPKEEIKPATPDAPPLPDADLDEGDEGEDDEELAPPTDGGNPPQQQARIIVSPTNFQASVNGAAIVNLVVVGATNIKGARVELDFPTDILKFEGAEEGTFLKMGGGQTVFNAQEARPGLVTMDMNRSDGGSSSGSGLVARVRFKTLKAGQARVNFGTIQYVDASGQSAVLPGAASVINVVGTPGG